MPELPVLIDESVVVAASLEGHEHHVSSRSLIENLSKGQVYCTGPSWAEASELLMKLAFAQEDTPDSRTSFGAVTSSLFRLQQEEVSVYYLSPDDGAELQRRMNLLPAGTTKGLKGLIRDFSIIACARANGVQAFLTWKVGRYRQLEKVHGLRVCTPSEWVGA